MDINGNGLDDFQEAKSFYSKCKDYIKKYFIPIGVAIIILLQVVGLFSAVEKKSAPLVVEPVKQVTLKLKDDAVCFNLKEMDLHPKKPFTETTSKISGKEIFGVTFIKETPENEIRNSAYLTLFENVNRVDKLKEFYTNYLDKKTNEAEKLSK